MSLADEALPLWRVWVFFGLVFLTAIPFLALGALTGAMLLPGLPIAALMAFCPAAAAAILVWNDRRGTARAAFWGRLFARRAPVAWPWLIVAALLPFAQRVAEFLLQRLSGAAIPAPSWPGPSASVLAAVFVVAAIGEEMGWTGYALDPLRLRFGSIPAALLLGVVWAGFHVIALRQADRSVAWIAWWSLGTVAYRVIMTCLYEPAGRSLWSAVIYHASVNLTWQLYPVHGSWFDPKISAAVSVGVALALLASRPQPGSPRGLRIPREKVTPPSLSLTKRRSDEMVRPAARMGVRHPARGAFPWPTAISPRT